MPASQKVLVVDDNTDSADSLALLLSLDGHQTRTAYSGPDAIREARDFMPETVFLDIGLPGMNGYEVAKAIREESLNPDMILVALTGWGSQEDRNQSVEAGFNFHITKPVDLEELEKIFAKV